MKKLFLISLTAVLLSSCGEPKGKYRVQVGVGDNAAEFQTDSVRREGECIHFAVRGDSVHACGPYSIMYNR